MTDPGVPTGTDPSRAFYTRGMSASEFTHLDPLGRARMVDVTAKEATHRRAVARCRVHMAADTAAKIKAMLIV